MNEALEYLKEHAPEAWADRSVRIALKMAASNAVIAEMQRIIEHTPQYTPEQVIEAENGILEILKRKPALWYEFKSDGEFYIDGRGKVFSFDDTGVPLKNIKTGDRITIDDKLYEIAGIESYAIAQPSRDLLTTYGILVKEFPY